MKSYLIHFIQTIDNAESQSLYWRCDADDYEHAIEQLKDEVENNQNEKLIFSEIIKQFS